MGAMSEESTPSTAKEITLRPPGENDLPFLEGLTQDPELTGEFQWQGWYDLRRWRRGWNENALISAEGGTLIIVSGTERLGFVNWGRHQIGPPVLGPTFACEIGMILLEDARGKGVGTQAARLIVRYLFAHTTVHRIWASTEVENIAAQRGMEKAGFTREGVTRASGWRDGAWRDGVVYSYLRTDPRL